MRQDHEKVVAAAREDMARFDQRQALERWLQNFVDPAFTIRASQWCVVTKEVRGWKAELGDADTDAPHVVKRSDPGAPAPPVMEIRPPKPEPVPPRFNVPEPRKVNSFEQIIADSMGRLQRQITDEMMAVLTTADVPAPTDEGLTLEKLAEACRDLPRDLFRRDFVRVAPRFDVSLDFDPDVPCMPETSRLYTMPGWAAAKMAMLSDKWVAIGADYGMRVIQPEAMWRTPPTYSGDCVLPPVKDPAEPPIKRPPPASSARNK